MNSNVKYKFIDKFSWDKILLICAFILSLFITWNVTGNFLDSDAASELIYANHLFQTKQLFSADWIYSTEFRVLCMATFFYPLFYIFTDWHVIRFIGAILAQLCFILSFIYMMKVIHVNKKIINIGAILLLLPLNVAYGRVVLYHNFYIVYLTLSFLLLAMMIDLSNHRNNIKTIIMLILSFLCGLIGIRYFLILFVPLFLILFWIMYVNDQNKMNVSLNDTEYVKFLIPLSLSAFSAFIGLLINKIILVKVYDFASYFEYKISLIQIEKIRDIVNSLFNLFGFRTDIQMISSIGILSMLCAMLCIFVTAISIKRMIALKYRINFKKDIVYFVYLSSLILILIIFVFTGNADYYYYPLYLLPVYVWSIPTLIIYIEEQFEKYKKFNLNRLVAGLCVVIILANSFMCFLYFCGFNINLKYEGLTYNNKNTVSELKGVINYLNENNYKLGYATFWNSNVIIELTDGDLKMININYDENEGTVSYYDWLTTRSDRNLIVDDSFVLLRYDEEYEFITKLMDNSNLNKVYEDDYYVIFDILNHEKFVNYSIVSNN